VANTPAWRNALLLPAWLTANPTERSAYEAVKRELATEYQTDEDGTGYTEAKKPWLDEATARAEEWANQTNWHPTPAD
jgi:dephospho-CoA kinase